MLLIKFQLSWIIVFRGDVQDMNSQHFPRINVYRTQTDAWGSKFDIGVKRSNVNAGVSFSNFGRPLVPDDLCKD